MRIKLRHIIYKGIIIYDYNIKCHGIWPPQCRHQYALYVFDNFPCVRQNLTVDILQQHAENRLNSSMNKIWVFFVAPTNYMHFYKTTKTRVSTWQVHGRFLLIFYIIWRIIIIVERFCLQRIPTTYTQTLLFLKSIISRSKRLLKIEYIFPTALLK